ncbi:mechanosensitive ion channel family protein [Pseudomonas sp. R5(2019)]|uniref:mechanosensitive ion channel family protein n=1 Tax=Pseudomonas sp. R5(2019) TaxID=2697566 RepID=UPI001412B6C0|nr:mechanosensitive ion channel family protein [Pseudomonas sp. R5(2019)]NBA94383.1 mechanosensitive ion channel [Pseudomonas sp. R5(2019)]
MLTLIQDHPLAIGACLLILDLLIWRTLPDSQKPLRIFARLLAFVLFSWVLISAGMSPLQPAPWVDDVARNLLATVLEIFWWLFAARTLTVVLGLILISRSGHTGRLLQDVMGAVIFLIAIVAAAAYVMQLPVKGLLATSGAMAIIVGLALQSTLSDVFSGIVLNTTKPYQIDDLISIDGTEGRVTDIDWRATRLLTSNGSMAVIPNSVAAKAKILNFSRPSNIHGVSISVVVPTQVRPRRVLDALEKALQGTSALLTVPKPKASIKATTLESTEYEASGFVASMDQKGSVRNHLFDLAHRHLEASGVVWNADFATRPWTRQRGVLEDVKIFRSLSTDEKDQLAQNMTPIEYAADQVILGVGESAEYLLVIGTGVVSASVHNGSELVEAGRMGPGEVLGAEHFVEGDTSNVEFRTLTSCILFRIEKEAVRSCLDERSEVKTALTKLHRFRQQASQSLLLQKPAAIKKAGFLDWLQRKV